MLIINILLILLFLIILLYKNNIIEGQGTNTDTNTETTTDTLNENKSYSTLNIFPELFNNEIVIFEKKTNEDHRNKTNLFGLFGGKGLMDDPRDINHEYLTCKDRENNLVNIPNGVTIHEENIDENIDDNQKDIINNLLHNFDIRLNIDNNNQQENNQENNQEDNQEDTNIESKIPICDLVKELYNNSDTSNHENILDNQNRDCFFDNNDFVNLCEKTCYEHTTKDLKIMPCMEYEISNSSVCPDLTNINLSENNNFTLLNTIITNDNNNLHYNCMNESIIDNIKNNTEISNINELNGELTKYICNPNSILCNSNLEPSNSCENVTMEELDDDLEDEEREIVNNSRRITCESNYISVGDKKYNCIYNDEVCTDNINISDTILKKRCHLREELHDYEQCELERYRNENNIKINEGETEYIVTLF